MTQEVTEQQAEAPTWLERAVDQFDQDAFRDGDVLSHAWIRFALDVPEPESMNEFDGIQWLLMSRMDAFRDYLLVDRKIALQNVRGKGYRLVPPNEQAQVAVEEAMRAVRKGLEKGDRLMTHTRLAELDAQEQKRHTDAHVRLSGIAGMMTRQKRDLFKLFGPGKG